MRGTGQWKFEQKQIKNKKVYRRKVFYTDQFFFGCYTTTVQCRMQNIALKLKIKLSSGHAIYCESNCLEKRVDHVAHKYWCMIWGFWNHQNDKKCAWYRSKVAGTIYYTEMCILDYTNYGMRTSSCYLSYIQWNLSIKTIQGRQKMRSFYTGCGQSRFNCKRAFWRAILLRRQCFYYILPHYYGKNERAHKWFFFCHLSQNLAFSLNPLRYSRIVVDSWTDQYNVPLLIPPPPRHVYIIIWCKTRLYLC